MRQSIIIVCLSAAAAFAPERARAQFHVGPIASGAGGAGRAAVDASESAFMNPASLSFIRAYNVDVGYQRLEHQDVGDRSEYSALIADGNEDRIVPGALGFAHRFTEPGPRAPSGTYTEQDFSAAASGLVVKNLAVGLGLHRQLYMPSVGSELAQNNVTLGALWAVTHDLGLAAVGYDFVESDGNDPYAPSSIRQRPTYALGVQYSPIDHLRVRADLVRPTEGPRNGRTDVMLGLESQFLERWLFRAGTQWKETDDQCWVTTGIGFHGPRLSFDYAFQKDVRVAGGVRHVVDLWLPL